MKLHEEFKEYETLWDDSSITSQRKLTEGHEVFDLGHGYYADIDEDQYGLYPAAEEIDVDIYKNISGYQNPIDDKYIKTVTSVDEAREYVDSLFASPSTTKANEYSVMIPHTLECPKCGKDTHYSVATAIATGRIRCEHCNASRRVFFTKLCPGCRTPNDFFAKLELKAGGKKCDKCGAQLNLYQ